MQSPQLVESKQGSTPAHSDKRQAQDEPPQLPVSGPVALPAEQVPVSPHHPQRKLVLIAPVAQSPQLVLLPQSSAPAEHSKLSQLQFPAEQLPVLGPVEVPSEQLPLPSVHHPHLELSLDTPRVQSLQSALRLQSSGVVQALGSQSQSVHEPASGPAIEPAMHMLLLPHQPQPSSAWQSPQLVPPQEPATGAEQVPLMQTSDPVQLPLQHGSPSLPQPAGGAPQRPSVQTKVSAHSDGGLQQISLSVPQGEQAPPTHTRPLRHSSSGQHPSPERPQSPAGAWHWPVGEQIRSAQQSLGVRQELP